MTTPSDSASSNNQPAADVAAQAAAASAAAAQTTEAKAAADAAAAATSQASEKAAADKAAADKVAADAAAAANKPAVAPEKYEAFTAPEGVTLDAPVVEAFSGIAKELGLPQDKAQALIDKVAPAMQAQNAAAIEGTKASLLAAAKADKDIGGDKFDESVATAKLAIDAYFTPDFAKFLNATGLGNHPEMIRGLMKAGAPLKQDGHVLGGRNPSGEVDAKSFYNKSNMNA